MPSRTKLVCARLTEVWIFSLGPAVTEVLVAQDREASPEKILRKVVVKAQVCADPMSTEHYLSRTLRHGRARLL